MPDFGMIHDAQDFGKVMPMKLSASAVLLVAAGLVAGCSGSGVVDSLGLGKSSAPDESAVRTYQNLAMPPDLQLRAPPSGATNENQARVASSEPTIAPEPQVGTQASLSEGSISQGQSPVSRPMPQDDAYAKAGISKFKADGTPKTQAELDQELKAYYIAQKRAKNPNYGTVYNLGNIFADE